MANADRLKPVKRRVNGKVGGKVDARVHECALKSLQGARKTCAIDLSGSAIGVSGGALDVSGCSLVGWNFSLADSPEKTGTPDEAHPQEGAGDAGVKRPKQSRGASPQAHR